MSREITGSKSGAASPEQPSLMGEMVSTGSYKPNQGRIVRQVTLLAMWVVVGLGNWSLYNTLNAQLSGNEGNGDAIAVAVPAVLIIVGFWVTYRLVQWVTFADFLIAVEAEMKKVSWPSQAEVKRASIVVMVTIGLMAVMLFVYDAGWQALFNALWMVFG
ncbi:preprotein translocase subunit SecE [Stieleria bergensis]|uniref:Protein translocase subunit SecE n=1 Tax=Stieleria bergensis TaxID=2528025 RepID=A0A517SRE7_9BACT|nr:preprotein translocase subunit SecE [Planctomycetes bacterium SV_7m_r]